MHIDELAQEIDRAVGENDSQRVMGWLNIDGFSYERAFEIMGALRRCLVWAAKNNHVNIVDKLTGDLRVNDMRSKYAIKTAAKAGHLDVIKVLVANMKVLSGIDRNFYGIFIFYGELQYNDSGIAKIAAENKHHDIVDYLFEDKRNYEKCCAEFLIKYSTQGWDKGLFDIRIIERLSDKEIQHKCDKFGRRKELEYDDKFPNMCQEILQGYFIRREGCDDRVIKMLLERDQRQRGGFFRSLERRRDFDRFIDFSIKNKTGFDYVDHAGRSLLMHLVENNDVKGVGLLLENGAKTSNVAQNGASIFYLSAINDRLEILRLLINKSIGCYRLQFAGDIYCGQVGSKFDDFATKFTLDIFRKISDALPKDDKYSETASTLAIKSASEVYKNYQKMKSIFWDDRMRNSVDGAKELKRIFLGGGAKNLPEEIWKDVFKDAYDGVLDGLIRECSFEIVLKDDWFADLDLDQGQIEVVKDVILSKMSEAKVRSSSECFKFRVDTAIDDFANGFLVDRIRAKQVSLVDFAKDIVIASSRDGKLTEEIRRDISIKRSGAQNVIDGPNGVKGFVARLFNSSFAKDPNEINRLFCSLVCAIEDDGVKDLDLRRYIGRDITAVDKLKEIRDMMVFEVKDMLSRKGNEDLIGKIKLPKSANSKLALPLTPFERPERGFRRSISDGVLLGSNSPKIPNRSFSLDVGDGGVVALFGASDSGQRLF